MCSSDMTNITRLAGLITDSDREIYEIVNYVFLAGVVCMFGLVTNTINIIVFYKHGFNNTVTISFFSLAISDLCSLISVLWFGVCSNPLFINSDIVIYPGEIVYLTAGMPHICFTRITGWITVFITAERCLCIAIPLKIKQIVTPRNTTVIICVIYILNIASFLPEYATAYYDWKYFQNKNMSLLGLYFSSDHSDVEGLVFCLYSILGFASFVAVIAFTLVLVVELNRKSKWRMKASIEKRQVETMSNRDKKTMSMVAMIATVLIICFAPGVAVSMVTFLHSEFSIIGEFVNMFFVMWSFVFVSETINSSINIFFYYQMSMKYRETFQELFSFLFKNTGEV